MKKSELKNYIRENIISTLSEDTEAEIAKTKELTAAIQDLEAAKKEAGIEEDATPKGEDFFYDYLDIGMSYLEGFGKKHSLDDNQLEKLGKKIVDQLYKGDVGKAYDAIVKRGAMKEDEGSNFDELKKYQKMLDDAAGFFRKKADEYGVDVKTFGAFNQGIGDLVDFVFKASNKRSGGKIDENEDKEPSKAELKKTKGLAKAKEELALLTREMKSLAKKYSKAEGEDKEKLVKVLKDKTKLKKELESILDK
jgi:hypothetical protein